MMSWTQYKAQYPKKQVDECYSEWRKLYNETKWNQGLSKKYMITHSREDEDRKEKAREYWRLEKLQTVEKISLQAAILSSRTM